MSWRGWLILVVILFLFATATATMTQLTGTLFKGAGDALTAIFSGLSHTGKATSTGGLPPLHGMVRETPLTALTALHTWIRS